MNKISICTTLFFFYILQLSAQNLGNAGIKAIAPTPWSCFDQAYNHPPFRANYAGPSCGFNIDLLLQLEYWIHCNMTSDRSNYWFRTFSNIPGQPDIINCYDAEGEGGILPTCDGALIFPFGPTSGLGAYFQIDLYSQCTACTSSQGTGSWWSSQSTVVAPFNQSWFTPNEVDQHLNKLSNNSCAHICLDLRFISSPPCTCESTYGCGDLDQG